MEIANQEIKIIANENSPLKSAHLYPNSKSARSEHLPTNAASLQMVTGNDKFNISQTDTVLMAVPISEPIWLEIIEACIEKGANFVLPDSDLDASALANLIIRDNITYIVSLPRMWSEIYHQLEKCANSPASIRAIINDASGYLELQYALTTPGFSPLKMDCTEASFAKKHLTRLEKFNITDKDIIINALPEKDENWLALTDAELLADASSVSLEGENDISLIVENIRQHNATVIATSVKVWDALYPALCENPGKMSGINGILVTEKGAFFTQHYPLSKNMLPNVS